MNRSKGEKTRELIIDSAIWLFAEFGFDGTSFQLIAEKCKLSQPAAFYYFKTKEQLLLEVIQRILLHNRSLVFELNKKEEKSSIKKILTHFEGNLLWATKFPREAQVILLLYYMGGHNPLFGKVYQDILNGARASITQLLIEGVEKGEFQIQFSKITLFSETLHDLLLGAIVNTISLRSIKKPDSKSIQKKWKQTLTVICNTKS